MATRGTTEESRRLFSLRGKAGAAAPAFGYFSAQPDTQFVGYLTIPDYSLPRGGSEMFPVPEQLRERVWQVRTEDGQYGTILFPRVVNRRWHSGNSMTVEFEFSYFLNKVSLEYDDPAIREVMIESLAFPAILGVQLIDHKFNFGDDSGTATFAWPKPLQWTADNFSLELASVNWSSAAKESSEVAFRSIPSLRLTYKQPQSAARLLEDLRAIDDFVSVLVGRYVRPDRVSLGIDISNSEAEQKLFVIEGHGTRFEPAEAKSLKFTFASLSKDIDWARLLELFLEHRSKNRTAFKWFRTSQTNQRFIEENFLYGIRLVDRYFRVAHDAPSDPVSIELYRTLLQRSDGDDRLTEFVESFIGSTLRRAPSLTNTMGELYNRYPEILAFQEIDARQVVKLRNRETHGADTEYDGEDYGNMIALTRGFLMAFRSAVLEACGIDRDEIFRGLRSGTFANYLD